MKSLVFGKIAFLFIFSFVASATARSAQPVASQHRQLVIRFPTASVPRFWEQLKSAAPNFLPPQEPLTPAKNSYHKKISKLREQGSLNQEAISASYAKGILDSKETKLYDGRLLSETQKIVNSSECGYSAEEDGMSQVSQSVQSATPFARRLQLEVLAAAQEKNPIHFAKRNSQYLNYVIKNYECSYAGVQLALALGELSSYADFLKKANLDPQMKSVLSDELKKLESWAANTNIQAKIRQIFQRETASIYSAYFDPSLSANEKAFALSLHGEINLENSPLTSSFAYGALEWEKEYEEINKKGFISTARLPDFLGLIYTPTQAQANIQRDARLFAELIEGMKEKKPSNFFNEMNLSMAKILYQKMNLKDYGLKSPQDLVESRSLAELGQRVMENPKLRFALRKEFLKSDVAMDYLVYLSLKQSLEASFIGFEERLTKSLQNGTKALQEL